MNNAQTTLTNWLLSLGVVALFAAAQTIDGPDDIEAQADQLADLQTAQQADAAQQRIAIAAQAMCGQNAAWQLVDATTVQCMTKRGHRTHKVTL